LLKYKALQGSQKGPKDNKEKGRKAFSADRPVLSVFLNEVRTFLRRNSACRQKNLTRQSDSSSWDTIGLYLHSIMFELGIFLPCSAGQSGRQVVKGGCRPACINRRRHNKLKIK
jgi:hypothetical protein